MLLQLELTCSLTHLPFLPFSLWIPSSTSDLTTRSQLPPLDRTMALQEETLQRHEHMLRLISSQLGATTQQLAEMKGMLEATASRTPSAPLFSAPPQPQLLPGDLPGPAGPIERALPTPEPFHGDLGKCGGFLTQCLFVFQQQRTAFASDGTKIGFILGLLRGRALDWGHAVLQRDPGITYREFLSQFKEVFDKGSCPEAAVQKLINARQGKRSVADFSVDFRILAAEAGWEEKSLRGIFLNSLNDEIKYELATRDLPPSLGAVISLCIRLDDRLSTRRGLRNYNSHQASRRAAPADRDDTPEEGPEVAGTPVGLVEQPMQLGHSRLSAAERRRRMASGECLYCGLKGHFINSCPTRPKGAARR
uniref:CCHC-type domain-containing protein n=1 Tax=Amphilophus citrinellus TaxID=61819 RepID=A0A3Q0SWR5_AMPCI